MTRPLYEEDPYLQQCDAYVTGTKPGVIILDKTVFYPLGGGQPGDTGYLLSANGEKYKVMDTRKHEDGIHHIIEETALLPETGEALQASIDWERRYRHMRMHTCLHLLTAVIDAPVSGGNIGTDSARLDFDLPESIHDKQAVTDSLNILIEQNIGSSYQWITDAELDATPELIKTMSVKPPRGANRVRLVRIGDIDLQPCGGTHVASTGEIGRVHITRIEKKSRHNRRFVVALDPH